MKKIASATACLISIVLVFSGCARQNDDSSLKGPYLGQKPPGDRPEVFAPGIVSTGLDELNSVFSPDGSEFYFSVRNFPGAVSIFRMKMKNETWSGPELLPFASRYGDIDVTMSPDGTKILFSSRRPRPGSREPQKDNDFWMAERQGESWGAAVYLGSGINSDSEDYYPMMTKNGTIYFSSQREGPRTNNIYRSEFVKGRYAEAVKLGDEINTAEYREYDPYISPNEDVLIFTSERPDGFGWGDLYISFKDKDGRWTKAKNMGERINSPGPEYCAQVSPDGKYLFFTSTRVERDRFPDKPLTFAEFKTAHNLPSNGVSDIYWVDAKIIEALRLK